jgi:hypothetical protein
MTSSCERQQSCCSGVGWGVRHRASHSRVNQISLGRSHWATQRPALCRGGTFLAVQDFSVYLCFRRPCGGRKLLGAK